MRQMPKPKRLSRNDTIVLYVIWTLQKWWNSASITFLTVSASTLFSRSSFRVFKFGKYYPRIKYRSLTAFCSNTGFSSVIYLSFCRFWSPYSELSVDWVLLFGSILFRLYSANYSRAFFLLRLNYFRRSACPGFLIRNIMLPIAVEKSSRKIKMYWTAKKFNSESLTVDSFVAREIVLTISVHKISKRNAHDNG